MIFISFSQPYFKNRLSKIFILNLLQRNYELAQLYVDFSHVSFSGYFLKLWHGWKRRTMRVRVLSGRSFSRSLSFNCFRCAMKIPV
ncbi:hypothetical protein Hanom_Chr04g00298661 [Helianthus anomalus]